VSLGHYKLKQHKPQFNEEYSKLLVRTRQPKLQWLQNPSQMNGDNMDNEKCEASMTKEREYLKDEINELVSNRTKMLETCTVEGICCCTYA
jgi:hypothetical protein